MGSLATMCMLEVETVGSNHIVGLDVHTGLSFPNFCFMVGEQWPDLMGGGFNLKYSVGLYQNCRLGNQADLNCLYSLVTTYSFKVVDIIVSSTICFSNIFGKSSTRLESEVCSAELVECNSGPTHIGCHWTWLLKGVDQRFGNIDKFRKRLNKFCIECGFEYRCPKNTKQRVTTICTKKSSTTCLWTLTTTVETSTNLFIVRKFNPKHDCDLEVVNQRGAYLSKKVISEPIENEVKRNPSFCASAAVKYFSNHYGYIISYKKSWRAIATTVDNVFGDHTKSYQELRWWTEVEKYTKPGSHIILQVNPKSNRFKRVFVSFGACIQGFKYIPPMIFIDATSLSGIYHGTFLCATGKNGQGGLYALTYVVVDAKTITNWEWFLLNLRGILDPDR